MSEQKNMIIVLDFGGQYNQLIARRVRECHVYCEVKSYKMPLEELKALNPKGIIFTGGPNSVYDEKSPHISKEIFVVIEQIAAEENIRIVWEKEEITHWNLIGSPGYVKRIMMNILSNAVKYNKENGYIYISCQEFTSEQEGRVTIEFICRDTGIGMTKDFQKRLFEPFAQEHTGSRTKFSGTGLGMPITKKLIEKMGGTITFESKKGEGTTFVIRIPFKIDQDADQREEQEAIRKIYKRSEDPSGGR